VAVQNAHFTGYVLAYLTTSENKYYNAKLNMLSDKDLQDWENVIYMQLAHIYHLI